MVQTSSVGTPDLTEMVDDPGGAVTRPHPSSQRLLGRSHTTSLK